MLQTSTASLKLVRLVNQPNHSNIIITKWTYAMEKENEEKVHYQTFLQLWQWEKTHFAYKVKFSTDCRLQPCIQDMKVWSYKPSDQKINICDLLSMSRKEFEQA